MAKNAWLAFVFGLLLSGTASAACNGNDCDTKAEAIAKVAANGSHYCPVFGYPNGTEAFAQTFSNPDGAPGSVLAHYLCVDSGNTVEVANATATWSSLCVSGQTYNASTHTCGLPACPGGASRGPDGQCTTDSVCKARNADLGLGMANRTWIQRCVAGCNLVMDSPVHSSDGFNQGTLRYTGVCAAPDAPSDKLPPNNEHPKDRPEPEPDTCTPAPNGQSFCAKPDGNRCYSLSGGRQLCTKETEVPTEKHDGPSLMQICHGTDCGPPTTQPPLNDTLSQTSNHTETTTTNTTTTVTTYITYTTGTGAPIPGGNQGCPTGQTCNGKDDNKNSSSGGFNCKVAPTNGGDPLLAQIATQAWQTRCAVEALGTNPDGHDSTAAVNAQGDRHGEVGSVIKEGTSAGANGLNTTGMGWTRTCPRIDPIVIKGTTIDLNPPALCSWMQVGGQFVLLLAALASCAVMAGARPN